MPGSGFRVFWVSLCLLIGFPWPASGQIEKIENCGFNVGKMTCAYPPAVYHIRMPHPLASEPPIPVIVFLHDAGEKGTDILDIEHLTQAFLERGYAVLALDAAPRKNRFFQYLGSRPGMIRFLSELHPIKDSDKKFVARGRNGSIRTLISRINDGESGWYYYNIDRIYYVKSRPVKGQTASTGIFYSETDFESDYIGRDETQVLLDVLSYAAEKRGTRQRPTLIAGVGHGASLVWQFACYAPELAELYAPIGGAFWRNIPKNCHAGARLVHTHERGSAFWPLDGASGSRRRFARTGIFDNLEMLLEVNVCNLLNKIGGKNEQGVSFTTWADCMAGGPIELIVTDHAFDFPPWWSDEILRRIGPVEEPALDAAGESAETGPIFKQPGTREGTPASGSVFKRPGAGASEHFKSAR